MKNVLITGMTAAQSSPKYMSKSTTFSSTIANMLKSTGANVDYGYPSAFPSSKELQKYDAVLVGIAPLLSFSANNAYSALGVIKALQHDMRLSLFIDAPDPEKIIASLRSVSATPNAMLKGIYKNRKGYSELASDKTLFSDAIECVNALLSGSVSRVFYPGVASVSSEDVARRLLINVSSTVRIDVDSLLIDREAQAAPSVRNGVWAVDNGKNKWFASASTSMVWPWIPTKSRRGEPDNEVKERIRSCGAFIASPSAGDMLWWSYRTVQALNVHTPIATDWRKVAAIGASWSHLPSSIEQMTHVERFELAHQQRKEFMSTIKTPNEAIDQIAMELKL